MDGPSQGEWSVFAEKVVAQRDAARAEAATLTRERDDYKASLDALAGILLGTGDRQSYAPHKLPEAAQALVAVAKASITVAERHQGALKALQRVLTAYGPKTPHPGYGAMPPTAEQDAAWGAAITAAKEHGP